jgi:Endosomal/lysosomal potassium channel TMEM175
MTTGHPRRGVTERCRTRRLTWANSKQAAVGQAREGDEQARAALEWIRDPSRVLALSDGVFAIIMTLLVLDIRVPQLAEGGSLTAALCQLRPSLTAFVISFIVASMYWVGHRDLFGLIRRADRGLLGGLAETGGD